MAAASSNIAGEIILFLYSQMKHLVPGIKRKLQLSFLSLVLLSSLGGIFSYRTLAVIVAQENLKSKVDKIVSAFAEMRKQEKDFLLFSRKEEAFLANGESQSLSRHSKAFGEIKEAMEEIRQYRAASVQGELSALDAVLRAYEGSFQQLVRSYKIRGFKDHGLEGDMREIVHQLQQCKSKEEQWFALMLRRHEKDFFIRQDEKYIQTLHQRAAEFKAFVKTADMPHMSPEYKATTLESINDYQHHFNRIARMDKEIGLNPEQGLLGIIAGQTAEAGLLLNTMQQEIYATTSELTDTSLLITLVSVLLMILGGAGFAFVLAKVISAPIIKLSHIVAAADLEGSHTIEALEKMKRKDELGKLIQSFGSMFREMKLKVGEISEKNAGLELAAQKEKERSWRTEGLSLLESILSQHAGELQHLCDQFLFHLVKYTGAHQAVLYTREEGSRQETSCMKLRSCYALHKKRYHQQEVQKGEGLVGAVWLEREAVYMNDIPEQYSKIRSGLGEARPTALIIMPALFEGTVEGVIEIGALKEFTENERGLVQDACKAFAGAVARVRMQEQTRLLLLEANRLTEELQARLEVEHA